MENDVRKILENVKDGTLSVEEALGELKHEPFKDIGYAKVDLHRRTLQGAGEVIFAQSKTTEQIKGIIRTMLDAGQENILITRLSEEKAAELIRDFSLDYSKDASAGIIGGKSVPDGIGTVLVITAGTSDIPVAEEAAVTAEFFGNKVTRVYDAGVAGIHRLFAHSDDIMNASVIVAIAGMEGALASVVGGLADCPVIAVPTSVGYGASFGGLSALLSMLNSCASGVSVVNIDNGFGAGYMAGMINHMNRKIFGEK